jgi:hypothetical protein
MGRTLKVNEARLRPQFRQDGWEKDGHGKGGGRRHDSRRRSGWGSGGTTVIFAPQCEQPGGPFKLVWRGFI